MKQLAHRHRRGHTTVEGFKLQEAVKLQVQGISGKGGERTGEEMCCRGDREKIISLVGLCLSIP